VCCNSQSHVKNCAWTGVYREFNAATEIGTTTTTQVVLPISNAWKNVWINLNAINCLVLPMCCLIVYRKYIDIGIKSIEIVSDCNRL
jgi:hypothetical protein